jgi:redox-sensitive bicupin YhaK (pirin superfamily)
MKTVFHPSQQRGSADHGWLKAKHSFSFAGFYDPAKMGFGALRVLNDDHIDAGMGFGTHPHDNMEIITIPLEGDVEHKDSMGNGEIIRHGDIQVMSAGTGIRHSELNPNSDQALKLLQIWVLPQEQNVSPRYDQITLQQGTPNQFQQVLSPSPDDDGVWIHQQAWFYLGDFDQEGLHNIQLKGDNPGAYVFVIEGHASVGEQTLGKRDALGLWDTSGFDIQVQKDSRVLVMEVPMGNL